MKRWPFLTESHARRLVCAYGKRTERILGTACEIDELGQCFTDDLTAAEVRYLVEHEWAQNAEDVLWRRSKLGLIATELERSALDRFIVSLQAVQPALP